MNRDAKRYYAILGVDPACSDDEIRHAFRRRAKELHPDAESGSANAFISLKNAYDTLGNPLDRARYDRARSAGLGRFRRQGPARPPRPPVKHRPGGISIRRYVVAFLFMAGLSYGAIEWMISLADVPAGATMRMVGPSLIAPASPTAPGTGPTASRAEEHLTRPGPGFFDTANPTGSTAEPKPRAAEGPWPAR